MTAMMNVQLQAAVSDAHSTVGMAHRRGWPIPEAYTTAQAIHAAAAKVQAEPEPVIPPPPATAKDVPAWCRKLSTARLEHREAKAAATDLDTAVSSQIVGVVRSVVPDYLERLQRDFADLAETFGRLLKTAPRALSGYEEPDDMAAHAELLRTVNDLTTAAFDRGALAVISGESASLGTGDLVWLLTDPRSPTNTTTDAVIAVVNALRNNMPRTFEQWRDIHDLFGLNLAGINGAMSRRDTYLAALQTRGATDPSMGMQPMDWTALLADSDARAARTAAVLEERRRQNAARQAATR